MPKPLRDQLPSSSVARLLDAEAAARATLAPGAPLDRLPDIKLVIPTSSGDTPNDGMLVSQRATRIIKREFILDPDTDDALNRLLDLYRRSTETRLSASHVIRAMLRGAAACMDCLQHTFATVGSLKLPSNAPGQHLARQRFEDTLADAYVSGVRNAAAYRRQSAG